MLGILVFVAWATLGRMISMTTDTFAIYTAICMLAMVEGFKL